MVYCLSFNGYLHGVLTPGFPLGKSWGFAVSTGTYNIGFEVDDSCSKQLGSEPPASAGGCGWIVGFSVVLRWWFLWCWVVDMV
jgi:hypothetical protein